MRIVGFLGLLFLAVVNGMGLYLAVREHDLKGVALMLFMVGLLVFFGYTLWRGARLARQTSSGERMADGWAGESVGSFLRNQVATSLEGHILIFGTVACFLMALVLLISPEIVLILPHKAVATATFFGLSWPLCST